MVTRLYIIAAKYYNTGEGGIYPVITYMELQDIYLTSSSL